MQLLNSLLTRFTDWFHYLTLGGFLAAGAFLWARRSWLWLLILAVAALCFLCLYWLPERSGLGAGRGLWAFVLVLLLGMVTLGVWLGRLLRTPRAPVAAAAAPGELPGGFPEVDAAWEEIRSHLARARIALGGQHVFLMIAPDEGWPAALLRSAGPKLFAQVPEAAAPIHAYATADGIFLSCAGASSLGARDAEGAGRLEHLCRLLLAERPDCPVVRGVAVLFPIGWAVRPDACKLAAAVRDDLRTIRRVFKVRCPVFALFPGLEALPGLAEFVARLLDEQRSRPIGFTVPVPLKFERDQVRHGLDWLVDRFHGRVLALMAADPFARAGNNSLLRLALAVRGSRRRLHRLMESAFSTHPVDDPVPLRGCYLMATGGGPDEQAFARKLFRGPGGRVLADHVLTDWAEEAHAADRRYKRMALIVGSGGGLIVLLAWSYIILSLSRLWGGIGLTTLGVAYAVVLGRLGRW